MFHCRYLEDQRVGPSQVGVYVVWRAAGSLAASGNGRNIDAGVLRHSLFQPVTSDYACVIAPTTGNSHVIQQRLDVGYIAGLPRRKVKRNETQLASQVM